MVINLKRRPERLGRFLEALRDREPWLLEPGRLCRVEGRDGKELPHHSPDDEPSFPAGGHSLDPRRPVAKSLRDTDALVRDGWVTAAALDTAETGNGAFWPNMTAGGLGLYLGHAAAWQHILDKDLDYGLIFEDDLTLFAPSFRDNASAALAGGALVAASSSKGAAPARWDLLYLQRCDDDAWKKERVWEQVAGPQKREPVVVPLAADANVTCTGAYVLSKEGARKLLKGALPASLQLDKQLAFVPGLVRAALSPPVAQCQEIFKSKVGGRYRDTDVQNKGENLPEIVSNMEAVMTEAANKWLKEHPEADHPHPSGRGAPGVWSSAVSSVFGKTGQDARRRMERDRNALLAEAADVVPSCGA